MNQQYTKQKNKVVTVMRGSETMPLDEREVGSIVDIIQANGGIVEEVDWLRVDYACDIYFAVLSCEEMREMMLELLKTLPFDFVVQETESRKKKLLISDMDSTMIDQECIDELADFAGLKEKISDITERAMNGELDFKEALRERVAMLEGLNESVMNEAFEKKITLMSGAKTLVQTMRKNGAQAVLVSGGFTFFTQKVSEAVGFHVNEANVLLIEDGKLTGKVKEPILDKEAKLEALRFYCDKMNIGTQESVAVGDGANDLPMIQGAGLGIAYHAKPSVREQAWAKIDSCDLTALLYAQGYRYEEFVA